MSDAKTPDSPAEGTPEPVLPAGALVKAPTELVLPEAKKSKVVIILGKEREVMLAEETKKVEGGIGETRDNVGRLGVVDLSKATPEVLAGAARMVVQRKLDGEGVAATVGSVAAMEGRVAEALGEVVEFNKYNEPLANAVTAAYKELGLPEEKMLETKRSLELMPYSEEDLRKALDAVKIVAMELREKLKEKRSRFLVMDVFLSHILKDHASVQTFFSQEGMKERLLGLLMSNNVGAEETETDFEVALTALEKDLKAYLDAQLRTEMPTKRKRDMFIMQRLTVVGKMLEDFREITDELSSDSVDAAIGEPLPEVKTEGVKMTAGEMIAKIRAEGMGFLIDNRDQDLRFVTVSLEAANGEILSFNPRFTNDAEAVKHFASRADVKGVTVRREDKMRELLKMLPANAMIVGEAFIAGSRYNIVIQGETGPIVTVVKLEPINGNKVRGRAKERTSEPYNLDSDQPGRIKSLVTSLMPGFEMVKKMPAAPNLAIEDVSAPAGALESAPKSDEAK